MTTRTLAVGLLGALLTTAPLLAQTPIGQPPATDADGASVLNPNLRSVDFGVRLSDVDGDEARFNRYRDLRTGVILQGFRFTSETDTRLWRAEADNVGYRDQRYSANFEQFGRFKGWFEYNQIPYEQDYSTRTPYTVDSLTQVTVDDSLQARIQAGQATLNPVVEEYATPFELRTKRDITTFGGQYQLNRSTDINFALTSTGRKGNQPWGSSFGMASTFEVPAPVQTAEHGYRRERGVGQQEGAVQGRVRRVAVQQRHGIAGLRQPAAPDQREQRHFARPPVALAVEHDAHAVGDGLGGPAGQEPRDRLRGAVGHDERRPDPALDDQSGHHDGAAAGADRRGRRRRRHDGVAALQLASGQLGVAQRELPVVRHEQQDAGASTTTRRSATTPRWSTHRARSRTRTRSTGRRPSSTRRSRRGATARSASATCARASTVRTASSRRPTRIRSASGTTGRRTAT